MNKKVLNTILGFSAGVMIAASFWSLLSPAIDLSLELGYIVWLLPATGFIVGSLFVLFSDRFLDKVLKNRKDLRNADSLKRSILLISAITIHNIPEGMAVRSCFWRNRKWSSWNDFNWSNYACCWYWYSKFS